MNGKIEEATLERMEKIRGTGPIRRGLDKAINDCLTKLEDGICADTNEKKEELENKTVTTDNKIQVDCLNDGCKEELTQDA